MNETYLMIVIIIAGIIELSAFLKENNRMKKINLLIVSGCYFAECIFYYIVKDDLVSSVGCILAGCVLVICLFFRFFFRKKNIDIE